MRIPASFVCLLLWSPIKNVYLDYSLHTLRSHELHGGCATHSTVEDRRDGPHKLIWLKCVFKHVVLSWLGTSNHKTQAMCSSDA